MALQQKLENIHIYHRHISPLNVDNLKQIPYLIARFVSIAPDIISILVDHYPYPEIIDNSYGQRRLRARDSDP